MEMKVSLKPYTGPPYLWKVLVNGKWRKMSGFDEEHITNQLHPKKAKKITKIKEKFQMALDIVPKKMVDTRYSAILRISQVDRIHIHVIMNYE